MSTAILPTPPTVEQPVRLPAAEVPIPAHGLPQRTPRELLAMARRGLVEAAATRPPGLRFATGHLAALRAAAAVVAARTVPASDATSRVSLWVRCEQVAPELSDWCASFASSAATRAAAEAGVPVPVSAAGADGLCARAAQFVDVVAVLLGDAPSGSPGDLADCDGLPADLDALVDTIHARMGRTSRAEQAAFATAWTLAVQAVAGADLSGVAGAYFDWRDGNIGASDVEAGAKLVELVAAVTR